jgi:hypothetical protein
VRVRLLESSSGPIVPVAELLSPAGQPIPGCPRTTAASFTCNLTATGSHTILVEDLALNTGDYLIAVGPPTDSATGPPIDSVGAAPPQTTSSPQLRGGADAVDVAAPDTVKQLAAAEHPFRMPHEKAQQAKFGGTQFDVAAIRVHAVTAGIQYQAVRFEHIILAARTRTAQHRLDARERRVCAREALDRRGDAGGLLGLSFPVQAALSLGLIGLAFLALLPGRRMPENLR